jgi:hypothetical protein
MARLRDGLCASSRRQFQALECSQARIDGLLAAAGACISVDPALRAQAFAVLGAEWGVRDREYELLSEQGLEVDLLAIVGEDVEVLLADLGAFLGGWFVIFRGHVGRRHERDPQLLVDRELHRANAAAARDDEVALERAGRKRMRAVGIEI